MRPAWMSSMLIYVAFMLVAYHILESFRNIFRHWLESCGKFAYLFGYFFSFSRPKKLLDIFLCDLNILFGFFVSQSIPFFYFLETWHFMWFKNHIKYLSEFFKLKKKQNHLRNNFKPWQGGFEFKGQDVQTIAIV